MYMAFLANLGVNAVDDILGTANPAFAAAGLRKDKSVDADHAALRIDEAASAVSGINGASVWMYATCHPDEARAKWN